MSGSLKLFLLVVGFFGLVVCQVCPTGCNDNPPEADYGEVQYTCQQQQEFGQCDADFMAGFCECTCGKCTIAVEEKSAIQTAQEIASDDTPVTPYPFLSEMSCTDLLSLVRQETIIRQEFQTYDGLTDFTAHEDVTKCITDIDTDCPDKCCEDGAQNCGCNKAGNNCRWNLYEDVSVPYMGLFVFENAKNKLCKCSPPVVK